MWLGYLQVLHDLSEEWKIRAHTDLQVRNCNFIWKRAIILARERFAIKIDMIHKGRYSRALIIIQGSFYYVQEDEDFAR